MPIRGPDPTPIDNLPFDPVNMRQTEPSECDQNHQNVARDEWRGCSRRDYANFLTHPNP